MQECPQAALCGRYNVELDFSGVLKGIWRVILKKKKSFKPSSPNTTQPFCKKIHPVPLM